MLLGVSGSSIKNYVLFVFYDLHKDSFRDEVEKVPQKLDYKLSRTV